MTTPESRPYPVHVGLTTAFTHYGHTFDTREIGPQQVEAIVDGVALPQTYAHVKAARQAAREHIETVLQGLAAHGDGARHVIGK